ncbi:hydroxymethylbilane synthase [Nakamurella flavida]|uniref:Porphobilinogen deaminase n=1 Tax=Nakamurella flavida TaxID=363630 RepID=A0A938YL10_9ACTN|nr:hydroxymethylbilane synthase [Nakamurella flavida]
MLRVGTRGSALALAQSGQIAGRIAGHARTSVDLVTVRTEGDVNLGPLASIGGTGVFVTGVRTALLAGRVDVIVHSLKDLPTAAADGIALASVPVRENPFDALCARDGLTLDTLPSGARVGTGSPRRAAQLLLRRPDLEVVPVRGNVDTRLGLVTSGTVDAVVLAVAGLARLDRTERITQQFGPDEMLPAPAQGALAVEALTIAADDGPFAGALRAVDDQDTRAAVVAERALLSVLEAGCTAPLGAFAAVHDGELALAGTVLAVDGSREIRDEIRGPVADAAEVGAALARRMLSAGAAALLAAPRT